MNNKDVNMSYDDYCNALQKSWEVEIEMNKCFPQPITSWVEKKCTELGVPFQYVAYPLLTSVAYVLGASSVKVCDSWLEPIIIYSLVSGRSGTNKSASLNMIKSIMKTLDTCDNGRQHVFDTGTMEGLMSTLEQNDGSVLCAVDEFSTFLDSIDKNSNGNAERSRYLSLWSGCSWSKNTKSKGLSFIDNPRFNFTGFNQNYFLFEMLSKSTHYDGFLPRFLIATPNEVFVTLGNKLGAGNTADELDISLVIQTLYHEYKKGCIFTLDQEAYDIFSSYHDNEVLAARKSDRFDDMKSTILSKSVSNVLRVAAVQCALRCALIAISGDDDGSETIVNDDVFETIVDDDGSESIVDEDGSETIAGDDVFDTNTNVASSIEVLGNHNDKKTNLIISADDINCALTIVRYSVNCVLNLFESTSTFEKKTKKGLKRSMMPEPNFIDHDFLILHRSKIRKLFEQKNVNGSTKVLFSKITKDHLYPQIAGSTGSENAKKFLTGLEQNGLGKFVFENSQKYFQLLNLDDLENLPEEFLTFLKQLGI